MDSFAASFISRNSNIRRQFSLPSAQVQVKSVKYTTLHKSDTNNFKSFIEMDYKENAPHTLSPTHTKKEHSSKCNNQNKPRQINRLKV